MPSDLHPDPPPAPPPCAGTAPADPSACANCGAAFGTPVPAFCPACGQESRVRAPTLGEFIQQFGGAYFATEGALWRTLKLLLFKPGELTAQYLAGRRKHYVLPLRLYLTVSLVTLLLVRVLAGTDTEGAFQFEVDLRKGDFSVLTFGENTGAGMRDGVFYCNGFPQWVCRRLQRRLDVDPEGLQRQAAELSQRAISNVGAGMFFLLPAFALWLKLAYLGRRRLRYTEHLVFALHLHAMWFILLGLMLVPNAWVNTAAGLAVPVYTLWAMRRVYADRWWTLLLRASVLSMLYLVTMAVALVGVAIGTLLS